MKEFGDYYLHAIDSNRKSGSINVSRDMKRIARLKFKVIKEQIQSSMKEIEKNLFLDNELSFYSGDAQIRQSPGQKCVQSMLA